MSRRMSPHRRPLRRNLGISAGLATVALALAACSGGGSGSAGARPKDALRLAISSEMPTLDPQTVYQYEGNQVLTAVYEGLLSYSSDSTDEIVPMLAKSYKLSDDGLTYTFALRDDVTFAGGRAMTSADVKASFERLAAAGVESQMAYMVAGVAKYQTPDEHTFVVRLKAPSSSFLSLVASPFGPKVIDSTVLEENKADNALEYLKTHTAGTGPYQLGSMTAGQEYDLTRRDDYWGEEPSFATVTVKVISDVATQLLQLEGGDLDIVTGQPVATLQQFAKDGDYQVQQFPTLQKANLHVKTSGTLSDMKLREALRDSIDRKTLVSQVWGDYAKVSGQMYPAGMVADGTATDTWQTATGNLATLAQGKTITLGYIAGRTADQQASEALQAQWTDAGATVELVAVQGNDIYGLSGSLDTAPDLLFETAYPDSAHPDTWARLFWYSDLTKGNGALNYLAGGTPAADRYIDRGAAATDETVAEKAYGAAGDAIHNDISYITLADIDDAFIMSKDLTGAGHWLPLSVTLDLRTLKRS
ncbi:ABC transporter substrate-binding protein [Kineosporia mesophila]|nr:ABC transporter substrate-binding protein [Kineosporia mesophila]MCD5349752.1 ABC transporter substrate-binding protein [Kineosporia mesophila]